MIINEKYINESKFNPGDKVTVITDYGEKLKGQVIVREVPKSQIPGYMNANAGKYYETENPNPGLMKGSKFIVWEGKLIKESLNESNATIKIGDHVSIKSLPIDVGNNDLKDYKDDAYYEVIKVLDPYIICRIDPKVAKWSRDTSDHKIHKSNVSFIVRDNKYLLNEDTVKKANGKWTNRGKDGEHGEFDTKKQADAQRRAMYANGFKG